MSDLPTGSYRDRDLYFFVSSRFIATLAIQVQSVAIGWQIYDMERTPLALGLVGLCQFLPMFALTLPAGDITDRFNQRRVYSLAAALQACCSALFLALSLLTPHTAWPYYLVLVLFGAARGFAGPSGSSLLPFLVPPARLPQSMAFSSSFFTAAVIGGPALGGFLYVLGPVHVYSICIAGFVGAALIVSNLGGRRFAPQDSSQTRYERVAEGVGFVRSRPVVLGAISLDLFAVLLGGATALLPVYARDILHVGPKGLGFLRSAPAVGAFTMAFVLTHWPIRRHVGAKMFAAVAIFGAATIVFGLSTWFWLSLLALFVLGASDMVSVNVRSSLIQLSTPDTMRGRVSSVSMLFIGASNELGEFESGTTAALMGTVPAVVAGGIGTLLVVVLWTKLFPPLRKVDKFADVVVKP
ncbi:MAG TPA: MFS transporter [Rhizomicrobium sp.]|jgi:MFS family permease|nr:MFS transporter [Rhizomicrobium sp.]